MDRDINRPNLQQDTTTEDLHREKVEQDRLYQAKLEALLREKQEQINYYQQKIEDIDRARSTPKDVQVRIDQLLEEKAFQDKLYNQRVAELKVAKEEQDKRFNEKVNRLRQQEIQQKSQKQQEIDRLLEDKEIRSRAIQNKIEDLKLEQQRHEEFFQEKIRYIRSDDSYLHNFDEERHRILEEKALQDKLFEDKLFQLENEKLQIDQQFRNQLEHLEAKIQEVDADQYGNVESVRNERAARTENLDHAIDEVREEKRDFDSMLQTREEHLRQDELREQKMTEMEYQMEQRQNMPDLTAAPQSKHGDEHNISYEVKQEGRIASSSQSDNNSQSDSNNNVTDHLRRLGDMSDFEVADDDPDIRGWHVYDKSNEVVGIVDELIVDPSAMKVRYLDVEIASILTDGERRHLLIPIGAVHLDEEHDRILIYNIDKSLLARCPAYDGGEITREHENMIRNTLSPGYQTSSHQSDFYDHEHYNTDNFRASGRSKDRNGNDSIFI